MCTGACSTTRRRRSTGRSGEGPAQGRRWRRRRTSPTTARPPRPSSRRPAPRWPSDQFEQAEAIALDVKSWGLSYGLFEDNPDKVAAAARALRRRDQLRHRRPREQPSQGVYDILVQESRQLMALGQWDQAEAKARQAQRMNVVPSLTADRADTVLHEIAMLRARQAAPGGPADGAAALASAATPAPAGAQALTQPPGQTQVPPAERASVVAEREANELLAKGDSAAASARVHPGGAAPRPGATARGQRGGEPGRECGGGRPDGRCRSLDPEGGRRRGRCARATRAPARKPGDGGTDTGLGGSTGTRTRTRTQRPAPGSRPGRSTSTATTPAPARWQWRRRRPSRASRHRLTSCSRRSPSPSKAVRSASTSRPSTPSARAISIRPRPPVRGRRLGGRARRGNAAEGSGLAHEAPSGDV